MNEKIQTKIAIISPSGNLYGSERVLLDFLKNTSQHYIVYLPGRSILLKEIRKFSLLHTLRTFDLQLLPLMYLSLFFQLLIHKLNSIALNEGGHIRYLKLLAFCFPRRKFFVHIRILEDTNPKRLGNMPDNIILIAVSDYISGNLKVSNRIIKIYDPFDYQSQTQPSKPDTPTNMFTIGIIGRVTKTKGIEDAYEFFAFLDQMPKQNINYQADFYGAIEHSGEVQEIVNKMEKLKNVNVHFKGFINDPSYIYSDTNCIVHFNSNEPLGRIFFEAINFHVPFIGFDAGGIGEIAKILDLQRYVVPINKDWINRMYQVLSEIIENPSRTETDLLNAAELMKKHFNIDRYMLQFEKLLI